MKRDEVADSSLNVDWEDQRTVLTTGYETAEEAAWYLTRSRVWPAVAHPRYGPYFLGMILFAIIVAMVILSPATGSHFIYTDF